MRTKLCLTACLLATLLLTAACGEKQEVTTPTGARPDTLTVMLDWFPNADHVGLYEALAEGYFRQVGLNVKVETPSDPSLPLKLLQAGKVDIAISYEPEVYLARNQNVPLISIAAIVQKPLTSIVALGSSHIRSVANLRGKTVGDAGIPYQHAYLDTILSSHGIPLSSVRELNVGDNLVPALLSHHVDAVLGAYWNYEAIQLRQLHKNPVVIPVDTVGVPTYNELVVVANRSTIVARASAVRRFIQALARGYEAVRANPTQAVNNLVAMNPDLDRSFQLASVKATLPDFFPASGTEWGWQDQSQWNAYGEWMMREHLISNPAALDQASSNDFLAGIGP